MQKEVVLQLFSTCPHFFSILVSRVFRKKFQKVCVLQRRACNKFKRNYLENYNDSEHAVKTKNAPYFINFRISIKLATFFLLDSSFKRYYFPILEILQEELIF